MPDEPKPVPQPEVRPLDLGLSEGKSMAFAPTVAVQPDGPPIGGLAPASPNGSSPTQSATPAPDPAASPPPSGSEG